MFVLLFHTFFSSPQTEPFPRSRGFFSANHLPLPHRAPSFRERLLALRRQCRRAEGVGLQDPRSTHGSTNLERKQSGSPFRLLRSLSSDIDLTFHLFLTRVQLFSIQTLAYFPPRQRGSRPGSIKRLSEGGNNDSLFHMSSLDSSSSLNLHRASTSDLPSPTAMTPSSPPLPSPSVGSSSKIICGAVFSESSSLLFLLLRLADSSFLSLRSRWTRVHCRRRLCWDHDWLPRRFTMSVPPSLSFSPAPPKLTL